MCHDGCAKRGIFLHQILNKNRLCLAHCALNRSFTVLIITCLGRGLWFLSAQAAVVFQLLTNMKVFQQQQQNCKFSISRNFGNFYKFLILRKLLSHALYGLKLWPSETSTLYYSHIDLNLPVIVVI